MDLEATSVADLELGKWEGVETAIAVSVECFFHTSASGVGGAAFVVGDGNFFSRIDVTDCVDGLAFGIAVPTIVSIWKTAVVNEANGRVNAINYGVGTAGQSVGFDNTAEWILATEIVMKRKELSLLVL